MSTIKHLTTDELNAGLADVLAAPTDDGTLKLIVRRPTVGTREVLTEGELDVAEGLVGDNWSQRASSRTDDGGLHPDTQLNLINSRLLALISPDPERRPLAGDQLAVELSLTAEDLPVGSRLRIGAAVIEVTAEPHTACAKFTQRFGLDAHRFVNSESGRAMNLRGINARVVVPGTIRPGDRVTVEWSTS